MNRRGFSLLELLAVFLLISLVSGIALPKFSGIRRRAAAVEIIAALRVVRQASYDYNASVGHWPAPSVNGQVPVGLGPYLPTGFRFAHPDYALSYSTMLIHEGGNLSSYGAVSALINDGSICQAVNGLLGAEGNADLEAYCWAESGEVFFAVDH